MSLLDNVFVKNFFHTFRRILHGGKAFQNLHYGWLASCYVCETDQANYVILVKDRQLLYSLLQHHSYCIFQVRVG